jgi:hypothetical protein
MLSARLAMVWAPYFLSLGTSLFPPPYPVTGDPSVPPAVFLHLGHTTGGGVDWGKEAAGVGEADNAHERDYGAV